MPSKITQLYLKEAAGNTRDAIAEHAKENRRIRIVVVTTGVFLFFFLPPLVWGIYRFLNEAYYQSREHVESVAYANLLGRGRRGKAIGAEQQRPFDVMTARQYLHQAKCAELAAKYEVRVGAILSEHNKRLREQRLSLSGNEDPVQGWYRSLTGHPTELVVKKLEITVTKNHHLLADLRIHGEPLGDDYWAQFFITDPNKLAWLFTWDNKLRTDEQQTLRANIKSDLISRMQARPPALPDKPPAPCYAVNQSTKFTQIGAKLELAQRLDDLKILEGLNFDLEHVYMEQASGSSDLYAKAKVYCVIGNLSHGHTKFEALLCMTSVQQNTWKIISTNAEDIKNPNNSNQVTKCIETLGKMQSLTNF
ncbi:hypothetical protein OAL35_02060 [bacterium]|nr:hypothetical protein [bacterium]